jgi:hypothetical protein
MNEVTLPSFGYRNRHQENIPLAIIVALPLEEGKNDGMKAFIPVSRVLFSIVIQIQSVVYTNRCQLDHLEKFAPVYTRGGHQH